MFQKSILHKLCSRKVYRINYVPEKYIQEIMKKVFLIKMKKKKYKLILLYIKINFILITDVDLASPNQKDHYYHYASLLLFISIQGYSQRMRM